MERITQVQIDSVSSYLRSIQNWGSAPEGKWNSRQIVGHLLDSAVNNLYRYHRIVINEERSIKGYSQDELVDFQRYDKLEPQELVDTWVQVNQLILNFVENIPADLLDTEIFLEGGMLDYDAGDSMTLAEMLLDYTQHIDHHLKQIKERQGLH